MSVFLKTIREEAGKTVAFTVLLTIAIFAAIMYYPDFKENNALLVKVAPPILRRLVGSTIADIVDLGFPGYVGLQHYVKGINVAGSLFAVLLGAGAVAREIETGTMTFLLSQPISRTALLLQKFAALAMLLSVSIFVSSLVIVPASPWVGERISLGPLLGCSAYISAEIWVVLSYAFLFSVLFDEQLRAGAAAGVITAAMVILLLLENTMSLSLFRHSFLDHLRPILMGTGFPWVDAAWFIAIAATLLGVAILLFRRKNL